jgi:glycogen synthase
MPAAPPGPHPACRAALARPTHHAATHPQVHGVLNGLDLEEWDPAVDPVLPANFSADTPLGKALCKRFLQRGLGLREDPDAPLVAVVSRLVPQKGVHLIQVG